MKPPLPPLLAAFVAAKNDHDSIAFTACFAADAIVRDEQQTHRGASAIQAWFEEVSRKYRTRMSVTAIEKQGGKTVLTAEVSGDFPGSPFPFQYHLTLKDDKIAALEITSD
ncbi:SnoaL-like domain protein [Lacunisphaera limnophila]|uniref:SnoaL-like domain protein n=1 Tax=Lacunisphaera limnophila TaxID=1838286 RepID=A0A1D8ATH3_9BACT|nr:nuclear transport factor 2 family protein [Lacunisphaera limnophila]AOS44187.1 SnoaL-like domain protein [Lacunisphaera limnophila]